MFEINWMSMIIYLISLAIVIYIYYRKTKNKDIEIKRLMYINKELKYKILQLKIEKINSNLEQELKINEVKESENESKDIN